MTLEFCAAISGNPRQYSKFAIGRNDNANGNNQSQPQPVWPIAQGVFFRKTVLHSLTQNALNCHEHQFITKILGLMAGSAKHFLVSFCLSALFVASVQS
jgi:hypothetical protein